MVLWLFALPHFRPDMILRASQAFSSISLLLILCLPCLRRFSYELFLRVHQLLAVSTLYGTWKHTRKGTAFSRFYVLGLTAFLMTTAFLQTVVVLTRHRFFFHGVPQARVRRMNAAVCIDIFSPCPISFDAGQFINLCIPGLSVLSFLQSHPFVVVATRPEQRGVSIQLMVEPLHGWTSRLTRKAMARQSYAAFFSGPHGKPIPVNEYGTVVMVASGWGIMAQIPHLQHIIRSFNNSSTRTRRIHLIWQLEHISTYRCQDRLTD
jgi:predicted ferric reductase